MPAPDHVKRIRSKKAKPVIVEYRWVKHGMPGWGWMTHGKYRDTETAEMVIKNQERKHGDWMELRIKDK